MDPTGTFPKVTAAGLTLSTPDGVVSAPDGVAPDVVDVVELPLALVTPVHPDWMTIASRSAMNIHMANLVRSPK